MVTFRGKGSGKKKKMWIKNYVKMYLFFIFLAEIIFCHFFFSTMHKYCYGCINEFKTSGTWNHNFSFAFWVAEFLPKLSYDVDKEKTILLRIMGFQATSASLPPPPLLPYPLLLSPFPHFSFFLFTSTFLVTSKERGGVREAKTERDFSPKTCV